MMPKVFISYSWTSQRHQNQIIDLADRLVSDGVDVVLDVYELKEGHDKYAFMERMVIDPDVTHVLVVSDKEYAQKADARKAGVGTESQIISKEIYEKVEQSKFIPLVAEFAPSGEPCLPVFLQSRIWIDFSTPESLNENWERLIRLLYGKPLHEKPILGRPPAFINEEDKSPASPVRGKYASLKQAILQGKAGITLYRRDFLASCFEYADALRVRERPDLDNLPRKILEDSSKLLHVRDHIVDWVLLESEVNSSPEFLEVLLDTLERLKDLKSRPKEIQTWNDSWFEAHALFVYETFLYIVASLLKTKNFIGLNTIFTSQYIIPTSEHSGDKRFDSFDRFYAYSEILNPALAPARKKLLSPAAELVKRHATRPDIGFGDLIQADLLVLLVAFITPDTRWYPQLFYYSSFSREFPFFVRAAQHKHFANLATITGIRTADQLRQAVKSGQERLDIGRWNTFHFNSSFWDSFNMDNLDTIK